LSNLDIEDFSISVYLERKLLEIRRRRNQNRYLKIKEVKLLEFTINAKQAIVILWTIISIILSLIVVLTIGLPYAPYYYSPWQLLVGLFFGLLLVMTLPIYLLIALWQALAKSESS